MRILIVGSGSIGRRHIANIRTLLPKATLTVWRQSAPVDGTTVPPPGANHIVGSAEAALETHPDAVVIANPAPIHAASATLLAKAGVPMLVEKPLTDCVDTAAALVDACHRQGVLMLVGYNFRFSPSLLTLRRCLERGSIGRVQWARAEVGRYLPEWRPSTDYRTNVSACATLGGGVVAELSHEIDYVRWILGDAESVTARTARLSDLEIDVEDCADILLDLKGGVLANIHMDMFQRAPTRLFKLAGTLGTLVWNGLDRTVQLYRNGCWKDIPTDDDDGNVMYLREMMHFLDCVQGRAEPYIDGAEGLRTLRVIDAVKLSSIRRRTVVIAEEYT